MQATRTIENTKNKIRLSDLDVAKTIAILLVILTHTIESSLVFAGSPVLTSLAYSIDRVGVPIFLMCMGALSLNTEKEINFTKLIKRAFQILATLVITSIITNAIYLFVHGTAIYEAIYLSFRWSNVIMYGSPGYAIHLWYLIMFTPLYLITPYIAKMMSRCSMRESLAFLLLCFIFGSGSSLIFSFSGKNILSEMSSTFAGTYVMYVIAGHLIYNRGFLNKNNTTAPYIGGLLFLLGIIASTTSQAINPDTSVVLTWYSTSPTIAISSIGAFLFIASHFKNKESKIATSISNNSFGAYLLHFGIIIISAYLIDLYAKNTHPQIKFILLFSAALLSFPLTWILKKNRVSSYFVS